MYIGCIWDEYRQIMGDVWYLRGKSGLILKEDWRKKEGIE